MLSEISQSQKYKCCMISLIYRTRRGQVHKTESTMGVVRAEGISWGCVVSVFKMNSAMECLYAMSMYLIL
jgi:hypothetical protein